jgi:protein-disulfide isomerase
MLKNLVLCISLAALAAAQTKPAHPAKPAAKPAVQLAATTSPAVAKTELPSEDTVNSFLYQTFGYDPTLTWKVADIRPSPVPGLAEVNVVITGPQGSGANKFYVSADGKHAITGEIIPFGAKPFEEVHAKLEKGINGPAKGPAKAPVTIVEFSDLQCPHCKQIVPTLEQLLAQAPDARFVFQNFPLPAHNWAEKAAGYVDCVGRASNQAVWKFIDKTFEEQDKITEANADEKLKAIATASGANADQAAACAAKPDTKARIEASIALGKAVGVTGTPAVFINGRMLNGGAPVDVLKKVVDFQAGQATAKQEGSESK